jgi:membrane fusion protein (multidrug efflux system)
MKTNLKIFIVLPAFLLLFACGEKKSKPVLPVLEMNVMGVLHQDVQLEMEFTGQVYGESDIEITPRVEGLVQSINFREGRLVQKGQLLYTIDPLSYENKVEQASGSLAEAQTNLAKTKSDLDMIEPLAKINAVSQRELVSCKALYEAAKAKIQSAEAGLRNAKIELGYCKIVAPISGLIGSSKVRVGDYVSKGPFSTINTISQLASIRVRFTISEQDFLKTSRYLIAEKSLLTGVGRTNKLILSDGSVYPEPGTFSFFDRQIDSATGSLTIETIFANPDMLLRPGQYAKVCVPTQLRKNALLIPQRAVSEIQGIFQVYCLDENNKAVIKTITPGPVYKDGYIVEEGLSGNEKIIVGGTQMLRPGMTVKPKNLSWEPGVRTSSSK